MKKKSRSVTFYDVRKRAALLDSCLKGFPRCGVCLNLAVPCAALLVGFVVVAVEGIGDITATEEASMLATTGSAHSRRIQGGILADGAPGLLSEPSINLQGFRPSALCAPGWYPHSWC